MQIKCQCGHAILEVSDYEGYVTFIFYSATTNSFWNKVRNCWKYLFGQHLLVEDFVFEQDAVSSLSPRPKNSKSETSNTGFKGIYYSTPEKRKPHYVAQVAFRNKDGDNVKHYIGKFETLEEAVKAREEFIYGLL